MYNHEIIKIKINIKATYHEEDHMKLTKYAENIHETFKG